MAKEIPQDQLWAIVLSDGLTFTTLPLIMLFSIGAVIMRGAGCVINDLWDRDLDKQVERTQSRPLASGQVSVKQTLFFLSVLLAFQSNPRLISLF